MSTTAKTDPISAGPLPGDTSEGRILVIDDDPVICQVLSKMLQRGGYKFVETARDAECAQAVLRRGGLGVVITDSELNVIAEGPFIVPLP